MGYDTFGDTTDQRDPNTNVTTTTYDVMGRPLAVTRPVYTPTGKPAVTSVTSTQYSIAVGQPDSTTDAWGFVTNYAYDRFGRLITRTEPDPDGVGAKTRPVWTYAYTRDNEVREAVDPANGKTVTLYNLLGQAYQSWQYEGAVNHYDTTYVYDDAGNRITSTGPLGKPTTTTYDKARQVTRVTDNTGHFTATGYDLAGRAVSTVSGQGSVYASPVNTTTYDKAGRAVATAKCAVTSTGACNTTVMRTSTTQYNNAGQVTKTTSAQGRITDYAYNAASGLLSTVTQHPMVGANIAATLSYDAAGNKTQLTDGRGNATLYTYTVWNLPQSTIEPSTAAHSAASDRTWTTVYDAEGNITEQQLPGGVVRTSTYDNLNRLTGETGSGGGTTTTARVLDYDPVGHLAKANSPAGNHTYTWNGRGLLASATGYSGTDGPATTSYTYDSESQLTHRADAAGTADFSYDDGGRLQTVSDPLTATTASYTYDEAGRVKNINQGTANSVRSYIYTDYGMVKSDTVTPSVGTSPPASTKTEYEYDLDDLVTKKTTTGVTGAGLNQYGYDGLARVTSWVSPAGQTTGYGYDAASNRTTVTIGASIRTSTYDARNRLTGTTGAGGPADTYTWNPRGQLTAAVQNGQTLGYTYDAFERLTQVSGSATPTTSYTYDSLDRVAQRNLSKFGYNDLTNTPIVSPAAAGETKILRDPLGAALAAKTGSAASTLLLDDPLHGDITATANATTGAATTSASFDPWGVRAGGAVPLGYQGGYTDPDTGLTNAHARWYNPTLGTFTSRDTVTLQPTPLTHANRYLYANANPLGDRDPTGHYVTEGGDDIGLRAYETATELIFSFATVDAWYGSLTGPVEGRGKKVTINDISMKNYNLNYAFLQYYGMGVEAHATSKDDISLAELHEDVIRQTIAQNAPQLYETILAEEHAQFTKTRRTSFLSIIGYTDAKECITEGSIAA